MGTYGRRLALERWRWLIAGCFAFFVSQSCAAETDHDSDNQIAGTLSPPSDDGVVYVRGVSRCTGTLVAPNLVLTAAHCVMRRPSDCSPSVRGTPRQPVADELAFNVAISIGLDPNNPAPNDNTVQVAAIHIPDMIYTSIGANRCGRDLALLVLEKSATYKDGSAVPTFAMDLDVVPARFRVRGVGYAPHGWSDYRRRQATSMARRTSSSTFEVVAHFASSGDSGGPAFRLVDGTERIAGVVSRQYRGDSGGPPHNEFCTLREHLAWIETVEAIAQTRFLEEQMNVP